MHKTLFPLALLLALSSCEQPVAGPSPEGRAAALSIAGELEKKAINEASGIALSARDPGILWVHNDSGSKARVYAIDLEGRHLGRLKLDDADNRDWEDMAAFVLDDTPYLLLADIGDNDAEHDHVTLYIVEEPGLEEDDEPKAAPAWAVRFTYPGGPLDAEAVAVDIANERVLILSKRELPPVLYSVPLQPSSQEVIEARRLGPVTSLPIPSRQDVEFAPQTKDWHWQPTAMDISRDGTSAIIMTYAGVYYFELDGDWLSSFNQQALAFGLRGIRDAEAVAFGPDGKSLYVTIERKHAPLFRIDMEAARK